ARRIKERPVGIELAILNNERNLVRSAGDADRVGLSAGVELVAQNVSGGETGKHIQASRAQGVVVKPEQRGWILWQLVGVMDGLCFSRAEPIRGDRRVAVAISRHKGTV